MYWNWNVKGEINIECEEVFNLECKRELDVQCECVFNLECKRGLDIEYDEYVFSLEC